MPEENKDQFNCPQCGKKCWKELAVKNKIWKNRREVEMEFCSEECASHYQMGCEG